MIDRYTKIVLTIIAASLVVLATQHSSTNAFAAPLPCGDSPKSACWVQSTGLYVATVPGQPLEVAGR